MSARERGILKADLKVRLYKVHLHDQSVTAPLQYR